MYRVQLYKESHLLEENNANTRPDAERAIDAMITAIHRGQHGAGSFRVAADRLSDVGGFVSLFFDSDTFYYPLPTKAK